MWVRTKSRTIRSGAIRPYPRSKAIAVTTTDSTHSSVTSYFTQSKAKAENLKCRLFIVFVDSSISEKRSAVEALHRYPFSSSLCMHRGDAPRSRHSDLAYMLTTYLRYSFICSAHF